MKARYSSSQNKSKIKFLKQNVLRGDLKDERDSLTESSRLFHNIGGEKEKACFLYVTEFTVGTVNVV